MCPQLLVPQRLQGRDGCICRKAIDVACPVCDGRRGGTFSAEARLGGRCGREATAEVSAAVTVAIAALAAGKRWLQHPPTVVAVVAAPSADTVAVGGGHCGRKATPAGMEATAAAARVQVVTTVAAAVTAPAVVTVPVQIVAARKRFAVATVGTAAAVTGYVLLFVAAAVAAATVAVTAEGAGKTSQQSRARG